VSLDQLNSKMDKCLENQSEMKVDIAKNTVDLSHHIKRTDMLEKRTSKVFYVAAVAVGYFMAKYGINLFF